MKNFHSVFKIRLPRNKPCRRATDLNRFETANNDWFKFDSPRRERSVCPFKKGNINGWEESEKKKRKKEEKERGSMWNFSKQSKQKALRFP